MRFLISMIVLVAACAPPPPSGPTYRSDVQPIIESRCGQCHQPGGIGPFDLTDESSLKAHQAPVMAAIADGRMPPWPADNACADYAPNGSLPDDERAVLEKWFADGAPTGPETREQKPAPQPTGLSRVDYTTTMAGAYLPQKSPDEYRCFLLDWSPATTKFITGFALKPGRPELVHHANVFFVNPESVAKYQQRDAAAPGEGYECFSFPNPLTGEGGWIGTFVPGSLGADFPEGTGLKMLPGSKVFIQVHYNLVNAKGDASDKSALQVKLADSVRREGSVQAWADPKWSSEDSMVIPAGNPDVAHRFSMDPTPFLSLANRSFLDGKPIKLHMATVHMHEMGRSAKIEIVRKDGSRDCLLNIPKWRFHWQLPYALKAPKILNPGDELAVECRFDNSTEAQPIVNGVKRTPKTLNWGEKTEDEMCVGGLYLSQ